MWRTSLARRGMVLPATPRHVPCMCQDEAPQVRTGITSHLKQARRCWMWTAFVQVWRFRAQNLLQLWQRDVSPGTRTRNNFKRRTVRAAGVPHVVARRPCWMNTPNGAIAIGPDQATPSIESAALPSCHLFAWGTRLCLGWWLLPSSCAGLEIQAGLGSEPIFWRLRAQVDKRSPTHPICPGSRGVV